MVILLPINGSFQHILSKMSSILQIELYTLGLRRSAGEDSRVYYNSGVEAKGGQNGY